MGVIHFAFVIFILLKGAAAQSEPSVQDAIDNLPPSLQDKLDKKQIDELQNKSSVVLKEKCEKNGGADAYPNVQKALQDLPSCFQRLVDLKVLNEEVEVAKQNGRVDEVFKKYCDKTPDFKHCVHNVLDASEPCFTSTEKNNLKTVRNVTEQLAEFICYKNGDRIALFIAEGGPECLQQKQEEIQSCINSTMGSQFENVNMQNLSAIESIPELSFGVKECTQLKHLQTCMVGVLESCKQPTTANIVDSLVTFIRTATPCKNIKVPEAQSDPDSSSRLVTSVTLLATTAVLALY